MKEFLLGGLLGFIMSVTLLVLPDYAKAQSCQIVIIGGKSVIVCVPTNGG